MPVTAKAIYISSSGAHIQVKASDEVGHVFSATSDMRDANISSPDARYTLQVSVVNCRDHDLTLVVRSVQAAAAELRQNVRIEPVDAVCVEIKKFGQQTKMEVSDISTAGVGLIAAQPLEVVPGETLFCIFHLNEQKICIESMVRRFKGDDGHMRVGLKFNTPCPFDEVIRQFVFSQQQQIIRRLKQLSAPAWLK